VKTEESQDALGFLEVAVNDALQVRNPAKSPALEVRGAQEIHADEDLDRGEHADDHRCRAHRGHLFLQREVGKPVELRSRQTGCEQMDVIDPHE
jgi:hypothetical protein